MVEEVVVDEDLAALMEARHPPAEHRGWPRTIVGPENALPMWTVGHAGWNALIRAAFTVLLPMQCEGQARPLRVTQVKERMGHLVFHGQGFDPFRQGVVDLLAGYSETACIRCGRPGELRQGPRGGWIRPECDQCWAGAAVCAT